MTDIIKKYDDNGNLIYHKDSEEELWCKYDKNGNHYETYEKNIGGGECWYEFDKKNNLIYYKCSYDDGDIFEEWYKYDEKKNLIYRKTSDDDGFYERWYKYDKKNKRIKITKEDEIRFKELLLCLSNSNRKKVLELVQDAYTETIMGGNILEIEWQYKVIMKEIKKYID